MMRRLPVLLLAPLAIACSDATGPQQPTEPSVLQLSPGEALLEAGSSYLIRVFYTTPSGVPLSGRAVLVSSAAQVATADAVSDTLAIVTAHAPGNATITAHMGGEESNAVTIHVYAKP